MCKKSQQNYLEQAIQSSIDILKKKVKRQKRKTKITNALTVSLGALITLTLGFDLSPEMVQTQKNTALVLGCLLTIVSGWVALFDYKKLWMRQKSTLLELYQLQNDFDYRTSNNSTCDVDDLFESYKNVWHRDGSEWRRIIKEAPFGSQMQQQSSVKGQP